MTPSKHTSETICHPTLLKSSIIHLPANTSERFTYHLEQILFLETELKNKDDYVKSLLKQSSRHNNIIYSLRDQNFKFENLSTAKEIVNDNSTFHLI